MGKTESLVTEEDNRSLVRHSEGTPTGESEEAQATQQKRPDTEKIVSLGSLKSFSSPGPTVRLDPFGVGSRSQPVSPTCRCLRPTSQNQRRVSSGGVTGLHCE